MPEGYDTMVGERGVTLSGGQRQRIAIARAIIRDTRILVMDEPTSGLDAQSEQMVFEALGRLMKGKTSIVIAHHLATIRQADVIFVVKDHTLVERGTHDELLASGGFYSELHNIQFREDEPVAAALGVETADSASGRDRGAAVRDQEGEEDDRHRHLPLRPGGNRGGVDGRGPSGRLGVGAHRLRQPRR